MSDSAICHIANITYRVTVTFYAQPPKRIMKAYGVDFIRGILASKSSTISPVAAPKNP